MADKNNIKGLINTTNNNIKEVLSGFKEEACIDYFGFNFLEYVYTSGNAAVCV